MMNFCTFFDSNYLLQGLAMYRSLERHAQDFHLYIYAFDDEAVQVLRSLHLYRVTVVRVSNIETKELKRLKRKRTKVEYYWTCTPFIIQHAIQYFRLPSCTYLDADLLFYDDPKPLVEELGSDSIQIVNHRYYQGDDKAALYGIYCVQFNTFKNDERGMRVLEWWRQACLDWCSFVPSNGKFGDQKYLDDWPSRFPGVHELQHFGGGVAPWNFQRYVLTSGTQTIVDLTDLETRRTLPLVFYHFHNTKLFNILGTLRVKSYYTVNMDRTLQSLVYRPYEAALAAAWHEVQDVAPEFRVRFTSSVLFFKETTREIMPASLKRFMRFMMRQTRG